MNLRWNNEREILLDYSHSSTGSEVRSLNALTSGSLVLSQKAYMKEIRSIFPIMIGEVFNIHSLYQNMTDCLQVSGILIKDSSLFFTATTIISNTTWCSTSQSCTFFFFFFQLRRKWRGLKDLYYPGMNGVLWQELLSLKSRWVPIRF